MNKKIFNEILNNKNNLNIDIIIDFILNKKIFYFEKKYLNEFNLIDKEIIFKITDYPKLSWEYTKLTSLLKFCIYNKYYMSNYISYLNKKKYIYKI